MKSRTLYLIAAGLLIVFAIWQSVRFGEDSAEISTTSRGASSDARLGERTIPPPNSVRPLPQRMGALREGEARRGPPPETLDSRQLIQLALRSDLRAQRSEAAAQLSRLALSVSEKQEILAALHDQAEEEIRLRAVELLKRVGGGWSISALEEAAGQDPSEKVRQAASEALGWLGN